MTMISQIVTHTPTWVFILFAVLLMLGIQQTLPRRVTLKRAIVLPFAMACFGVYGVVTAFTEPMALLAWAVSAGVVVTIVMSRPLPPGVRFDATTQRFAMPGSFVPLALMMGIFATKYAAGITLGQAPQLASQFGVAVGLSAVYGLFSGVFVGRAVRLWKLAGAALNRDHALGA